MKRVLLVLAVFLITSICKADAPSSYIYLPITVSAQRFQESQDIPPKEALAVTRFQVEDLEKGNESGQPILPSGRPVNRKYAGFLSSVSEDYTIKRNPLSLTPVPNQRNKDAIMFVFFMNPKKEKTAPPVWRNQSRFHMHVLGSKKVFTEPKVIENEYPIDLSLARYEDGYSSEDLNVVLPSRKPRKVLVSFLWNF